MYSMTMLSFDGFNSTLVRFKPLWVSLSISTNVGFNSTLVRFKRGFTLMAGVKQSCFNSTLVRFKHVTDSDPRNTNAVSIPLWFDSNPSWFVGLIVRGEVFQFHSGSIQTHCSRSQKPPPPLVSIPLWFDSNRFARPADGRHSAVSIPLWFDSNYEEKTKKSQW